MSSAAAYADPRMMKELATRVEEERKHESP